MRTYTCLNVGNYLMRNITSHLLHSQHLLSIVIAGHWRQRDKRINNYFLLSLHKLCPPVIKALLDAGETNVDGIIYPGP